LKFKLNKLEFNFNSLKNQFEIEEKLNKDLRSEKVNYASSKNELEDIFVKCLDEVR
jgi:hypothetical protein